MRLPRWMMVPSHSSRPVFNVIGRRKLTFSSTVVYPTPAGSIVCTAQPIVESRRVHAKPPVHRADRVVVVLGGRTYEQGAALLHLQRLEAHELSYGRRGLLASEDGPQER